MRSIYVIGCSVALIGMMSSTASAKGLAKDSSTLEMQAVPTPIHKFYINNGLDGGIFSTANMQRPGYSTKLSTLRFSYVINAGVTLNYDFSNHFGVFTGLGIKNVGFIEKEGDSTIKRRTYNLSLPLAIKVGNIANKTFFFGGLDLQMPFNYKEKGFKSRGHKDKFNEWFSDRTPTFMTGVFAGLSVSPGITFKLEYYLNNFLNTEYKSNGVPVYSGYDVHLILLSIGTDMHFSHHMHHGHKKKPKTGMM